jgi:hypothetical protein
MRTRITLRCLALILPLAFAIGLAGARDSSLDLIPAAEFSKIIQNFSEEGGLFLSDNLISNEDGYLSVLDRIRDLHISGGAYLGVGPEQNFTYIAKTRPSIAFLIDIRRQAMIQHLMYKAIFHLSKNPAEFLSHLLSRPLTGKDAPGARAALNQLVDYFASAPVNREYFVSNLAEIKQTIQTVFRIPLSEKDKDELTIISKTFSDQGINISFQFQYRRRGGFGMPSMRDLLERVDADGNPGNFLAAAEDYQFVRDLHEKNRIIPVVGDFAGPKALKAIAGYLRQKSLKVSVFYTSNVEMYLFQSDSFDRFVQNVKALPLAEGSLFIRSTNNRWGWSTPGYRMTTFLQNISVFLKEYQEGRYPDYWMLIRSAGGLPGN